MGGGVGVGVGGVGGWGNGGWDGAMGETNARLQYTLRSHVLL